MKNTKTAFRVVFCIIMTLMIVLSMASCDMKGAFESIGDGDFKGAWNLLVGNHKHEYVSVVTPPTCTEKGYTTYTCECGDSYVDDYVDPAHTLVSYERKEPTCKEVGNEPYVACTKCDYTTYRAIPMIEHNYVVKVTRFPTTLVKGITSKMCTGCGMHSDTYLDTVTFTLPEVSELIKSFVGTNIIEIGAKDSELVLIKEIETDKDSTYDKQFIAVNAGYIKIDGTGETLEAYFSLDLGIATYDSKEEGAVPTFEQQLLIEVIVNGEDVSVSVNDNGTCDEDDVKLSETFYTAIASAMGMTYDQLVESVYVSGKVSAFMPLIQGVVDSFMAIPEGNVGILSLIANEIIVHEGNVYKLDFTKLADLMVSMRGKTLTAIIDGRYGEGTMARIESFMVSLPSMKIRDIADAAVIFSEKCGASLDDVYAFINYVVYNATGVDFNIESEIIYRYNMTVVELISTLSGDDASSKEIIEATEELENNIQKLFDDVKNLDIDQIYNYLVFGNPNYSENGSMFRVTDVLASYTEILNEKVILEVTVSDEGKVEFVHLHVEHVIYLSVGTDASGDNFVLELYEEVDGGYEYHVINFNSNDKDVTFTYWAGSHKIIDIRAKKNENGEIISANGVINQVVTDYEEILDSTGENYISVKNERTEKVADLTYTNNGDGTYTLLIEENDGKQEIVINVTETEGSLTITGTINAEYYYNGVTVRKNVGSFSYTVNGESIEFTLTVDEIVYDFTESWTEDGECERVYDFENPKKYDIVDVVFGNDGNGNLYLSVDTNNVSHDNGIYDVKNATDVIVTVTTTDDKVVIDVESGEVSFKISVEYTKTEVGGEIVEGEVAESYNVYSVDAIKFELYEGEELSLLVEAEAIELENGVNFKFNIEGLEYTDYDYEYIDNSPEYDGSPVTIVFYHTMGQLNRQVLDEYISKFNEIYPNITIVHEQVGGYDDVRDQICREIAAGNAPNIAYCYPDHVALYNEAGAVVALDDFINDADMGLTSEELDNFIDGFYAEGATYDEEGTMYSLAMSKSTELLYYNKTFFEQHNLTVPTTWEELEEVCARIKEIDPDSIPFGHDSEANWFITMCAQYGSDYTSLGEDKFLFDNATNKGFVKMFREWYDNGYFTTNELYGAYLSSLFIDSDPYMPNCYMYIGSSAGAKHNDTASFEVGIAPIPQLDPTNPKVIQQGPSLCIFNKENKQEMAASWLFMKFLTTNLEFQAEFSMVSGYMPVIEGDVIVEAVPAYREWLESEYPNSIIARALNVAFAQQDAFFVSPAFNGSSTARDVVGGMMLDCFVNVTDNIDAMIEEAFRKAIAECVYQTQ